MAVFCKSPSSVVVGIYRGSDLINVIVAASLDEVFHDSRFLEVRYVEDNELGREVSRLFSLPLVKKGVGYEVCLLASALSFFERVNDD